MDAVLRAGAIYLALIVLFKISGRRSLGELTSFDFVLLMVIGEATQQVPPRNRPSPGRNAAIGQKKPVGVPTDHAKHPEADEKPVCAGAGLGSRGDTR